MDTSENIFTLLAKHWELPALILSAITVAFILFLLIKAWPTIVSLANRYIDSKRPSVVSAPQQDFITTTKGFETEQAEIKKGQLEAAVSIQKFSEQNDSTTYMLEMIKAKKEKNVEKLEEAFKKLQSTEADYKEKTLNEAFYLRLSFQCGNSLALQKLEELSRKNQDNPVYPNIQNQFAYAYYDLEQYPKVIEILEPLLANTISADYRELSARLLTNSYYKLGKNDLAYKKLISEINITSDPTDKCALLLDLAGFYEQNELRELQVLALSKALEIKPNDDNILFKLGYSFATIDSFEDLAYAYYKRLIDYSPNDEESGLNNIGILAQRLKLKCKAITYYKKALPQNTLAASNLALDYMHAGFAEEAKALLHQAANSENEVHPHVNKRMAELAEMLEEEGRVEKEILSVAIKKRLFLDNLGNSYFNDTTPVNLNGKWQADNSLQVEITHTGNNIRVVWTNKNGMEILAEGTITNNAAMAKCRSKSTTLLDPNVGIWYAFVSPEGLSVMHAIGKEPIFNTLTRIKPD